MPTVEQAPTSGTTEPRRVIFDEAAPHITSGLLADRIVRYPTTKFIDDLMGASPNAAFPLMRDCLSEVFIKTGGAGGVDLLRCQFEVEAPDFGWGGAITGAANAHSMRRCLVHSAKDACQVPWGGGVFEYNWLDGPGSPIYTGTDMDGVPLTGEQSRLALLNSFSAGKAVAAGEFFSATTGGKNVAYQAENAGTLGSDVTGWPFTTGTVFTSGDVTLWTVGEVVHQDGLQWTGSGFATVRRNKIFGWSNSAIIHQNAVGNVHGWNHYVENWFQAGPPYGTFWIYENTTSSDTYNNIPNSATKCQRGIYTRDLSGVWSQNADWQKSRPRALYFAHNYWDKSLDGSIPGINTAVSTARTTGDQPMFCRTVDDWLAAVAAQYGTTPDDPAVIALWTGVWNGSKDPANMDPSVLGLTIDFDVLEARFQQGIPAPVCDMNTAIVWDPDTNKAGGVNEDGTLWESEPMRPTSIWGGKSFADADGYFVGV